MANYGGLSYGNEVYCSDDILTILDSSGTITGTGKCFQVYNSETHTLSVTINGNVVAVPPAGTVDVIINTFTWAGFPLEMPEGLCVVCTCHDCNNPDGNAQRAVTWPVSATTAVLINPSSPYTLIGSGFLNS